MLSAIGYLVGSRVLDPTRLIGVVCDALLDPRDWSIRQLAVTVGSTRLTHTVGLDPQAIHADRPQDPERVKTLHWHPAPPPPTALAVWPADGRRGGPPRAQGRSVDTVPSPTAAPGGVADTPTAPRGATPIPQDWLPAHTLIDREVLALGQPVGRLQDLVFDDRDWRVRYLIVALHERVSTRRRRVLVDVDWLDRGAPLVADAAPGAAPDAALRLSLDATALRLSPGFEDVGSIDAGLAQRLPAPPPPLRVAMAPTVG